MRTVLLLLLLINLGFFAWHRFLGDNDGAAAQIAALQISPQSIVPVAVETVSAVAPSSTFVPQSRAQGAPSPASPAACVEWGPFTGGEVARADGALATLTLPAGTTQRRVTEIDGYWVNIPPMKSKGDVDRKVAELKALGVTEFFVVTDAGLWRNAVSLGLFKNEDAAVAELERLRGRGVRSAAVTRREKLLKQVTFFVREPVPATVARLTELQRDFPATEIKAGACPATPAAKS
jgi:hypothetical protein